MKISQIVESVTSSGSIATVESPLGTVQTRMQKPPKSPKVVKGKKYNNVISEETQVSEAEILETDLIVVPGMRKLKDKSFVPHDKDRRDHEVEMARRGTRLGINEQIRMRKDRNK